MLLPDVNVLVYAHREDAPDHTQYRAWLEDLLNSDQAYGMAELVLSGFLRIVTHSRIFNPPARWPRRSDSWRRSDGRRTVSSCAPVRDIGGFLPGCAGP